MTHQIRTMAALEEIQLKTEEHLKPNQKYKEHMTPKKTTQIVTIDEQFLPELRNWLEDRDGECKAWDLVLGQYGHLYLNSIPHSLVKEIAVQVAIQAPDKQFPPWMEVAESNREMILESATNSLLMDVRWVLRTRGNPRPHGIGQHHPHRENRQTAGRP